jgi:hypothetical protein
MDPDGIRRHIEATCPGVNVTQDEEGSLFFIHDPRRDLPPNRQIPFATVVVSDKYDPASDLLRQPGVFRLNIGAPMAEYRARFGDPPPFPKDGGVADPSRDYAVLDTLLPHPVYAAMGWVCVLNPDRCWPEARRLLALAYTQAATKA